MSETLAGVTFLAFGNGSPDVFSTFAAMKTHSGSLAVGELIGAAGFITAVVAGSMAVVRPFKVPRKTFIRDVGFFIVAASFSMLFLADGHLHLWECAVMVGFYIFYVITVVVWHWHIRKKHSLRERESAARSSYHTTGSDEIEAEPYTDNEDDDDRVGSRGRTMLKVPSADDFANLERGTSPTLRHFSDDVDEDTRDLWMAEISSNMRISRPRPGERRNMQNPIRPSLVGALEFRAVLSSLQKSGSIQSIPINLRRYSDDPTYTLAQQQGHISTASNPKLTHEDHDDLGATSSTFLRPSMEAERNNAIRARAVSENDVLNLHLDSKPLERPPVPQIDLRDATPPATAKSNHSSRTGEGDGTWFNSPANIRPGLLVSPAPDDFGYLATSPRPMSYMDPEISSDLLALPEGGPSVETRNSAPKATTSRDDQGGAKTPGSSLRNDMHQPSSSHSLKTQTSSPASPFPEYRDDPNFTFPSSAPSIILPPPSVGSGSTFRQNIFDNTEERPIHWWPHKLLPTPRVLISTLFPLLYGWHDKNAWEKFLGIVAAPSVLLLTVTLPVVESGKVDDLPNPDPGILGREQVRSRSESATLAPLPFDSPPEVRIDEDSSRSKNHGSGRAMHFENPLTNGVAEHNKSMVITPAQLLTPISLGSNHNSLHLPQQAPEPTSTDSSSPKDWNRWLVAVQIFTAPFFIALLYWANNDSNLSGRNLLLSTLYSLVVSLILLAILLVTTSASRPPQHRYLLCFLGFVVSIAWISTIAGEVVGVLKAFGVILGISDAILGLTIFAVGNSLGDLVADITVARLGYPVMALSACLGGPMLNILLGIGLSGLYMTFKAGQGRHQRHPKKPMVYKPYQINVGGTLIISGITLLVTLLGLLIVVPLNKWRMDRKIGYGLVALWCVSTIGNVVAEVLGWGTELS